MIIKNKLLNGSLTQKIIGAYYDVYNSLGYGFLEKVYENSMIIELNKIALQTTQQAKISVFYDGERVGNYFADIIVNQQIIVEIKAVDCLREEHKLQLLNYLKATKINVGLLFNFGKEPEFKRVIFTK
ncbi:MAG: GxxExxY protein [Spirochaetes bacterium]|nr:GxxExxY protein [Spirochaetota bacterium]